MDSIPQAEQPKSRPWSDVIGHVSAFGLMAVVGFHCLLTLDEIKLHRQSTEKGERLIQRLDSDAMVIEIALAHLEGRKPSEKSQNHWDSRKELLYSETLDGDDTRSPFQPLP